MSRAPLAWIAGTCIVCFGGALAASSALHGANSFRPVAAREPLSAQATPAAVELAVLEPWRNPRPASAVSAVLSRELAAQARRERARARRTRVAVPIPQPVPAPAPQPAVAPVTTTPSQPVAVEPAPSPAPAPAPVVPKPHATPKPAPKPPPPPPPTTTFFSSG